MDLFFLSVDICSLLLSGWGVAGRTVDVGLSQNTVVAVFDFLKKGGENLKKRGEEARKSVAATGGNVIDYVKRRAEEDIQKVNAFNAGLAKSREKLSRDLTNVIGVSERHSRTKERHHRQATALSAKLATVGLFSQAFSRFTPC